MARILLVDDDVNFTAATESLLKSEGHKVEVASTFKDADTALGNGAYDILFVDLSLPDGSGLELVRDEGPRTVIITGHPSIETAIKAVRGRVVDYLVKPLEKSQLIKSIEAVEPARDRGRTRSRPAGQAQGDEMIGETEAMQKLRKSIADYAATDVPVLVTGESGTGKELVARALHRARDANAPFVAINCGAIPRELIASELFGHEKGSFTGAAARRLGIFERAGKGTVFLDEIGDLPAEQQVTLLRVIETRTLQRVGGEKDIPVTARIVAATNTDLEQHVAEGEFREDLFFRLMVLPIRVPPLRERQGDIGLLAKHFLEEYAAEHGTPSTFAPKVLQKLEEYRWPGNVRELRHTMLRAAILNRGRDRVEELPGNFDRPPKWAEGSDGLRVGMSIREVERTLIEKTLDHFDGNKKMTAEALGISLKTLYNRLCEYEGSDSR